MNFSKWTPPSQAKHFPIGICGCGNQTRHTNRQGEFFCLVCDVDAKRRADKAAGIPFVPFTRLPCAGWGPQSQYPTE